MRLVAALKNPKVIQYTLELIFPMIGYFFFDWSLLIIIIFYLMDQFGSEAAAWFRLKFVINIIPESGIGLLLISIVGFLILFGFETYWLYDGFSNHFYDCQAVFFWQELAEFGGEFLILLPLLFAMHYMKDRVEFYRSDLPFKYDPKHLVVYRLGLNFVVVLFVIFLSIIWIELKFNEIWLLVIIPMSKLINDLIILPQLHQLVFRKN